MQPTVISEEPLSLYDAKKELKAVKKRDEELSFRSQKCEEYINQNAKLSEKAGKEMKQKLIELEIPRLKEDHICKLIDLMPYNADDIKLVLSGYNVTIKNDNIKQILEILDEYRK